MKKKSLTKRYRPVRVVNPSAKWHTTRLYPCQKMILKLRKPDRFLSSTSESARFDVELNSEFLIIEKVDFDEKTKDVVYTINQKFDLSSWVGYGEVLLGNIKINLSNNTHNNRHEQPYDCTICVVMQSHNKSTITVVNPNSNSVKVEQHQFLEIVCYESEWDDKLSDEWDYTENVLVDNKKNFKLKEVKYEVAANREGVLSKEDTLPVKNRFNFIINPYLASSIKTDVEKEIGNNPVREHHWWFAYDEETTKKINDTSNGVYPICTYDIEGIRSKKVITSGTSIYDQTYRETLRSLSVLLAVHGKNKQKMQPYHLNQDSVEHKMELTKRTEDRFKQILTNPLETEQVDFHLGYESIVIEMIQPSMLWNDLPDDARWRFEIEAKAAVAPKFIKLIAEDNIYRLGKLFQRLKVEHTFTPTDDEPKFLGAVYIICDKKSNSHRKRISFWYSKNDRKVHKSTYSKNDSFYHSTTGSKTFDDNKKNKTPRVYDVSFEEIAFSSLEDSVKTKKISDIWVNTNTHYSCWSANHEISRYEPDAKKKDSTMAVECKARETRNEKKEGNCAKSKRDGEKDTNGNDGIPAFIVHNPDHLYKVSLDYGQPLIIKMSLPNKLYPNASDKEQWALSFSSDNPTKIGDFGILDFINLKHFKMIQSGEICYQEILIYTENIQPAPDTYPVGYLKLTCSQGSKIIFIEVKVKKDSEINIQDVTPKIIKPTRCFDGVNTRKTYVREWCHGDTVEVIPDETLFIRDPSHFSGWDSNKWQMEIEQYPLKQEVWKHELLKDFIADIDVFNPWFKTAYPLQLSNTYVLRALSIQQPHFASILRAAANVLKDEYLVMGKFVFRNKNHSYNSKLRTSVGIIHTTHEMERWLYVCVSLNKYRSSKKIIVNPNHKDELIVSEGDNLVFRLTPRYIPIDRGAQIAAPWFVSKWPEFLSNVDISNSEGDNIFEFSVRNFPYSQNDWLRFLCGDSEKKLLIKYI